MGRALAPVGGPRRHARLSDRGAARSSPRGAPAVSPRRMPASLDQYARPHLGRGRPEGRCRGQRPPHGIARRLVGIMNNAGTDIASRRPTEGRVRWIHALDRDRGLEGSSDGRAGQVLPTGVATTAEIIVMNRDGLGLGRLLAAGRGALPVVLPRPSRRPFGLYLGPDGFAYALDRRQLQWPSSLVSTRGADRIKGVDGVPAILRPGPAAALAASKRRARGPTCRRVPPSLSFASPS